MTASVNWGYEITTKHVDTNGVIKSVSCYEEYPDDGYCEIMVKYETTTGVDDYQYYNVDYNTGKCMNPLMPSEFDVINT